MHMRIRLLMGAALCIASAVPARAMTLQPGTYKLEWKIPARSEAASLSARTAAFQTMSEKDAGQFDGLVSSDCRTAVTDGFGVILDESKGAGAGFDVAYILPSNLPEGIFDLKSALKLPLTEDLGCLESAIKDAYINIPLGGPGSQVSQKAAVDLEVILKQDAGGKRIPASCVISLRGGWYGTIPTDSGELKVQTCDINCNGIYNEKMGIASDTTDPDLGDYLIIGDPPQSVNEFDKFANMLALADVACYDGRLYTIDVSKEGDTINVKPYTGSTAAVRFEAKDGQGKPANCRMAAVCSKSGLFISADQTRLTIPAGEYKSAMAAVVPAQTAPADKQFGIVVESLDDYDSIKLNKDKGILIKIGGPVHLRMYPDTGTIKVKCGEEKSISAVLTLDNGRIKGITGGRKLVYSVRNSKGAAMMSGQAEINPAGACSFALRVPADWKTGIYKLRVSIDLTPYQGPLSVTRTLKIM